MQPAMCDQKEFAGVYLNSVRYIDERTDSGHICQKNEARVPHVQ